MSLDPTHDPTLHEARPTFLTHLECGPTGEAYEADTLQGLSRAGKPLLVRYDLAALGRSLDREALARRPAELWRYREFLPVRRSENIVSPGEIATPLIRLSRLEPAGGMLQVKDEGRLPTGSFKARGPRMAVSMAKELGVMRIAMPTAGNAGRRSRPMRPVRGSSPTCSAPTTRPSRRSARSPTRAQRSTGSMA
jgi:threonine synthase